MIEASLSLGDRDFLDGCKRVDHAMVQLRDRCLHFNQALEIINKGFEFAHAQFESMRQALDFGARMNDLAAQTGSTAGEMAVLSQAMVNSGLGADSASTFVSRFQKALSGLNEEGAETSAAFRQLGLDVVAIRKMPLLDQIAALQAGFQKIHNVNDRAKIASELFGKSGPQNLRFLVNVDGMTEAKEQVGGLKAVLDRNAEVFARLSHAFDALKVKTVQFYAGLAEGLDGNTRRFTDFLNHIDLTAWGNKLGQVMRQVASFIASLKPLLPFLELLAAQFVLTKMLSTNFAYSLGLALMNPRAALAGLSIATINFQNALSGIKFVAFTANIGTAITALGALNSAILLIGVALASYKFGQFLREKITHDHEQLDATQEALRLSRETADDTDKFSARRKKGFFSQEDKANAIKEIDDREKTLRAAMESAETKYSGDRLKNFQRNIKNSIIGLEAEKRADAREGIRNPWETGFAPVAGRTPVSALSRVGLSTNFGMGGSADPIVSEQRRTNMYLQNILNSMTGSPTSSRPPVTHAT